jgi:hypothetical protein
MPFGRYRSLSFLEAWYIANFISPISYRQFRYQQVAPKLQDLAFCATFGNPDRFAKGKG